MFIEGTRDEYFEYIRKYKIVMPLLDKVNVFIVRDKFNNIVLKDRWKYEREKSYGKSIQDEEYIYLNIEDMAEIYYGYLNCGIPNYFIRKNVIYTFDSESQ